MDGSGREQYLVYDGRRMVFVENVEHVIFWIIVRDRLITRARLHSWDMDVPLACLLCNSGEEDI